MFQIVYLYIKQFMQTLNFRTHKTKMADRNFRGKKAKDETKKITSGKIVKKILELN